MIVVVDIKRGKECSDVRKGYLKTVDVIERPKKKKEKKECHRGDDWEAYFGSQGLHSDGPRGSC